MAISFLGYKTFSGAGTTSNLTITFDVFPNQLSTTAGTVVHPQQGDIVFVLFTTGSTADRTFSTSSSGWTKSTELYSDGSVFDSNAVLFYKIMGATPDTSMVITGGTGSTLDARAGLVLVFRGVDQTTPLDVAIATATGVDNPNPNPPSITPTTSGALVFAVGGGTEGATAFSNPGSYLSAPFYTSIGNDTNDSESFFGIAEYNWTSGSVDPAQVTGGSVTAGDSWTAFTIALRPASGSSSSFLSQDTQASGLPTVGGTAAPIAPQSVLNTIAPPYFSNSNSFYNSTVTTSITLPASILNSNAAPYVPVVSSNYSLVVPIIDGTATVYNHSLIASPVNLTPIFMNFEPRFYTPEIANVRWDADNLFKHGRRPKIGKTRYFTFSDRRGR